MLGRDTSDPYSFACPCLTKDNLQKDFLVKVQRKKQSLDVPSECFEQCSINTIICDQF